MRIELTVAGPAGRHDVAIDAAVGTPLATVLPELAAHVGAGAGDAVWSAAARLDPATILGSPGLRTGCVLTFGPPPHVPPPAGLLDLQIVGGTSSGAGVPLLRGRITIGRGTGCDVVLDDDRASREHARLEIDAGCVRVHDLGSTNGTTIDGVGVGAGAELGADQILRIGDSLLTTTVPGRPALTAADATGAVQVHRPPRRPPPPPTPPIEVPEAGPVTRPGRVQWIAALVPAGAGVGMAWALDAPQFLLFALLSPVLLLSSALGDRVHWRRARRRAAASLQVRTAATATLIAERLRSETAARRHEAPDPAAVLRTVTLPDVRLWERRSGDADHLLVRLGSADLPSRSQVREAGIESAAGVVPTVPAALDLAAGPIGLAGPVGIVAGVLRWVAGQLVALHAPTAVELVLLVDARREPHWRWCRWLPHLRDAAAGPDDLGTVVPDLLTLLERRRAQGGTGERWAGRWVVLVVDGVRPADVPGLTVLLDDGAGHGITALCTADDARGLPAACRTVAVVHDALGTRLSVRTPAGHLEILADRVDPWWSSTLARGLAPLTDPESAVGRLPDRVRLGDLVDTADAGAGTADVLRAWTSCDGGARTVIGRSVDGPVPLDLVADGPHALVAGTTGSGKSELLRSLVVGLAASYPPDAMTFLLVDYKGGSAFADCVRLPHTVGLVTDLDVGLTARALRSLHAELLRREQLLVQAGAADLDRYRALGRTDLARLVIVVDEFAELSTELPDFVTGLVGVARRGRSLGVHLVLATQRPGSSVSAEIRANTSLRIALRVVDVADSTDVVDAPDAALLDPARPGRAFLRAGGALLGLQSAVVAAEPVRPDTPVVALLDSWRRPTTPATTSAASEPELAAVVDLIARSAARAGLRAASSPWLPPLPSAIALSSLRTGPGAGVAIGLVDAPDDLAQPALRIDLARDHSVLLAGRGGSGRTGALLTLAVAATGRVDPSRLHVHVVDGTGALAADLAELPHLGTVITPASASLVPVLLARLIATPPDDDVRTLLLVDDWDRLLAERDEFEAAEWTDQLLRLLRLTGSADVTVAVAGGRTVLQPRFAAGFDLRLVLALADRADYGLASVPVQDVPERLPPGAGVRGSDGAVFQLAHPGRVPGSAAAREAVRTIARQWTGSAGTGTALRLRDLPERVELSELRARAPKRSAVLLGTAGDTAEPCAIDLVGERARLLIAGPPRSGRTTALCTVLAEVLRLGQRAVVFAPGRSALVVAAERHGVRVLDPAAPPGVVPDEPTVLLVDDEADGGSALGEALTGWVRAVEAPLAVVVAARTDDLITSYRGVAAEVRRNRCGVLLRPGPVDGELFGVRTARTGAPIGPPGRGLLVGDPRWGQLFAAGAPLPVQLAITAADAR